jgi:sugar phosphate isomerase/epimerase
MKFMIQTGMLCGQNLQERFTLAAQLGFDALELTGYGGKTMEELTAEAAEAADRTGISAKALCGGYRGWNGDFDAGMRATAVADIGHTMGLCAGIGIEGIIAPAAYGMIGGGKRSTRTASEDREAVLDSLKRIADSAEKTGVCLYLEPLNRYEDHMINRMETAVELIDTVGSPCIRVMLDLFHGSIEEADLAASAGKYAKYIRHVHLADSNRLLPGLGHTGFKPVFDALKGKGFEGYLSYECGLPGKRDRATELADSLAYLKSLDR